MSNELGENVLPKNISNLSFQEIFELKNQLGEKAYHVLLSGSGKTGTNNRVFHRENKNRPREVSSVIIPTVIHHSKREEVLKPERKPIDPRFSNFCGKFNRQEFEENYKFLRKTRKKEKKLLMKKLNGPIIDEVEHRRIKLCLQRMDNQSKEKFKQKQKAKMKQKEREYQINELTEGRQPRYHRKSEEKLFDLVSQFEELKEKGGLIKHIKRRRKRLTLKDRKNLSFLRSST